MGNMKLEDIIDLKSEAIADVEQAGDEKALEEVRIKYLGRNGKLPEIMKGLKNLDPADRPKAGQASNDLKNGLQGAIEKRKADLDTSSDEAGEGLDYTLPGHWRSLGSKHPVSQIIDRFIEVCHGMGFTVAEGPDIDTVFNNFDALNTPADHPSRDPGDTFYLEDGDLLRCHTSPVQVRYMLEHKPPVRIIAPGRAFRRDTTDATHSANFHQVEGLYVNDKVSLADLKGDLTYLIAELMGSKVNIRFRPHFFPFTEPSVEVDFTCHVCNGKGECRVCKSSGWIEIAGAGMVDPEVFKAVGYDPEKVTGYAFGMGVERMAMILFGINDIRLLYENDVRFLAQF